MRGRIRALAIVVPARDEEALIGACLQSIGTAVARAQPLGPAITTFIVLDSCRDRTRERIDAFPWAQAIEAEVGCVGSARAIGVAAVRGWTPEAESNTWIACTDADSAVPATWLTQQCAFANAGMDVVVGTVEPREGDLSTDVLAAWIARHSLVEGHEHIHGANLGFTLAAYLAVGGFLAMPTHEDVHLVARLRAQGHPHVATDSTRVITSGGESRGRRVGWRAISTTSR